MYMRTVDQPKRAAPKPRRCTYCGGRFHPKPFSDNQRYCTVECRVSARSEGITLELAIEMTEQWVAEELERLVTTPSLIPWAERRLREAYGLDLRDCDRWQITEQMEDLWL